MASREKAGVVTALVTGRRTESDIGPMTDVLDTRLCPRSKVVRVDGAHGS